MKKYQLSLFVVMLMALLCGGFTSCSNDDDETPIAEEPDPEGTLYADVQKQNGWYQFSQGEYTQVNRSLSGKLTGLKLTAGSAMALDAHSNLCANEIVCVGKVDGLSSINTIPKDGWSKATPFVAGNGYIIRTPVLSHFSQGFKDNRFYAESDTGYFYSRVYALNFIRDENTKVAGGRVKFQGEWKSEGVESPDLEIENPNYIAPEFNGVTLHDPRDAYRTSSTENDVFVERDGCGFIRSINFGGCPNPPATAEEMFERYMGLGVNESFSLYRKEPTFECYYQRYKGVMLLDEQLTVRTNNGKVVSAFGRLLYFDDFNTEPAFDLQKAREIYAEYLGVPVKFISEKGTDPWVDDTLFIKYLPISRDSSEWAPRLVYSIYGYDEEEGIALIDAKTGRILMTSSSIIF